MFLDNKYTKLYYKLVSTHDTEGYLEKHHIIPTSCGGSNTSENIIKFSARKHFLCHYLLIKMIPKNSPYWHKMALAFKLMKVCPSSVNKRYMNSRLFSSQRENFSRAHSISQLGEKNSSYCRKWINNGTVTLFCKGEELNAKLQNGFVIGKIKKPKPVKIVKPKIIEPKEIKIKLTKEEIKLRRAERDKQNLEITLTKLRPQLETAIQQFMNGQSLRDLAPNLNISHQCLRNYFLVSFPEQMKKTIPRSNYRKQ